MTYLLPIPNDYSRASFDCSTIAFNNRVRDMVQQRPLYIQQIPTNFTPKVIPSIAIAIITCASVACLPKKFALGCIAVSIVAYFILAKIVNTNAKALMHTMFIQKSSAHLGDPKQGDRAIQSLKEGIKFLEKLLPEVPLLLEIPENHLPHIQLRKDKLLKDKADLEEQLESLQKDLQFFQNNALFLQKVANIWLMIDWNVERRMTACRDFMFYSVAGSCLIKAGFFFNKVFTKVNYTEQILIQNVLGNPYLLIALGGLSIILSVKKAIDLIAHRNDEVTKRKALATITQCEIEEYSSKVKLIKGVS